MVHADLFPKQYVSYIKYLVYPITNDMPATTKVFHLYDNFM
jgi:hypothetical protein